MNFRPHDPDLYLSAVDVIAATAHLEGLQGKFVVVALEGQPLFGVPFGDPMPRAEIHANVLETILSGDYLPWNAGDEFEAYRLDRGR